ncbi:hypothetical protein [Catenuloplanes japonicus]|uniref:hypothetical protein n=1 Tax=Catenuloplanes japonicus TaxID=33876 RepID=UPI000A550832|nr:hypothetical protein [Catenuloplanes japonicus]
MIEMVARDGPPEAMLCPAFICDACREQVVGSGNIYYRDRWVGDRRQSSPLFVSHKRCARAVEAILDVFYPQSDGWMDLCQEMRDFVKSLANNFTHAFADDTKGTYHNHDLVQPDGGIMPHFKNGPPGTD